MIQRKLSSSPSLAGVGWNRDAFSGGIMWGAVRLGAWRPGLRLPRGLQKCFPPAKKNSVGSNKVAR